LNLWSIIGPIKTFHHYDNSEFIAWLSAESLAQLAEGLNSSGHLRILAHSMGNVVTGEAIRRYSGGSSIHRYIATQAALSSDAWDNSVTNAAWSPGAFKTPNIHAYWYSGDSGSTNEPYFDGNMVKLDAAFNYYNPQDYALEAWEFNNWLKPDDGIPYYFWYDGSITNYTEGVDAFYRVTNTVGNVLSVTNASERCRIFAYCLESRHKALGQLSCPVFGGNNWNMEDPPPSGMGYQGRHYYHSKQWRSSIDEEWEYYEHVRQDADLGGLP
jgi:hypothetical protein